MSRTLLAWTVGLVVAGPASANPFQSVFATPLPPGPGTVPMTVPAAPLAAPVLMPAGAPTAASMQLFQYPADGCDSCAVYEEGCGRAWAFADFLYGASKGVWVPPLVTAAPPGVPPGVAGALGVPTTTVLYGAERAGNDMRPGLRAGGGFWWDPARRRGLDASLVLLGETSDPFAASSGVGGASLARPVVNGLTGTNLALPAGGGVAVGADTFVIGGDVNYRRGLCGGANRVDLLVGYRYMHLGDTTDVWQAVAAPVGIVTHDSFHTRNHFHGPQVGLTSTHDLCRWGLSLELLAKVAFGVTVSEADVVGTTTAAGITVPLGVLAGPSNAGAYEETHFAVVPELGAKLGCDLGQRLRVTTGYSFLYWSAVRRAPSLIDLTTLAPGRPLLRDRVDDVWVQGWTVGAELRY